MPFPCMQTSFSLQIAYTSSPPSRYSLILYLISLPMATQRSSSVTKNEERYVFSFPCTHIALAQPPVYTYPIYNKSIITTSPNTSLCSTLGTLISRSHANHRVDHRSRSERADVLKKGSSCFDGTVLRSLRASRPECPGTHPLWFQPCPVVAIVLARSPKSGRSATQLQQPLPYPFRL